MIHVVIGTRAQLLKMAPIMVELTRQRISYRWIYTAQHRDTMAEIIDEFELPSPDYVVVNWQTEAKTMAKIFGWFGKMMFGVLFNRKKILGGFRGPKHLILTHGDTVSTTWGALLGKLSFTKVMHIESGLRSFNLFEPFPEELNRIITFIFSDYYACPGEWAIKNLKVFRGEKFNTFMNTQIDTLEWGLKHANKSKLTLPRNKYVVVSIHRYENIFNEKRFTKIIELLEEISKSFKLLIVLHPNTKIRLETYGFILRLKKNRNIELVERMVHLDFIKLIKSSEFVITDGGGNQEELFHMGKPTLLFRESTERTEGLGKTALLSGLDEDKVIGFVKEYKKYKQAPTFPKRSPSKIIVDKIVKLGF